MVTPSKAPRRNQWGYDFPKHLSLEDAGFNRQPPAHGAVARRRREFSSSNIAGTTQSPVATPEKSLSGHLVTARTLRSPRWRQMEERRAGHDTGIGLPDR